MRQHGVRFAHRLVVPLSLYFPGPPNVTLYKSETGTPTVKKLVAGCFLVLAKNRGPGPHPGPHYSSTNSALVGCYFGNIPPGLFGMGDYVESHGRLTLSSSPTILTLPYHSNHPPWTIRAACARHTYTETQGEHRVWSLLEWISPRWFATMN